MSFRKNDSQQMTLFDHALFGLTAREQRALEHSWAKVFAEDVFPSIDESRFSVLYEVNTKSDSAMLKEHLDEMEPYVEEVTIFADGAYSGTENQEKAARKNVKLITTDLTGRDGTGDHWGVQG